MRRVCPQESGKEKEKEPVTIPPKDNVILLLQFYVKMTQAICHFMI